MLKSMLSPARTRFGNIVRFGRRLQSGVRQPQPDPEPLPEGHPLWDLDNAIITPHTADTPEMIRRMLSRRIGRNVAAFAAGRPLEGLVDPAAGY